MKNHVIPPNFRNFETNAMVTLENDVPEFEAGGGGLIASKVIKCKLSKSVILSSYAQRKYSKHHVRTKLGQGHQVQIFKKSVSLSFYAQKRHC